jgi:hypothetical protein
LRPNFCSAPMPTTEPTASSSRPLRFTPFAVLVVVKLVSAWPSKRRGHVGQRGRRDGHADPAAHVGEIIDLPIEGVGRRSGRKGAGAGAIVAGADSRRRRRTRTSPPGSRSRCGREIELEAAFVAAVGGTGATVPTAAAAEAGEKALAPAAVVTVSPNEPLRSRSNRIRSSSLSGDSVLPMEPPT